MKGFLKTFKETKTDKNPSQLSNESPPPKNTEKKPKEPPKELTEAEKIAEKIRISQEK